MRVDLLILQLAVIFLPGIIWARLDASYAAKVKPSEVEFFLRAFLFGLIVYAVEALLFAAFQRHFVVADLGSAATRQIVSRDVLQQTVWGLVIACGLAVLWLYVQRFKLLTRVLQRIGATKKYGDEDLWDFTFNAGDAAVEYVHFRDFENQYVYAGWVDKFSETDKLRELVLIDVIVYDFDGHELYTVERLYLARASDKIHIEFPGVQSADEEKDDHDDQPPRNGARRLR